MSNQNNQQESQPDLLIAEKGDAESLENSVTINKNSNTVRTSITLDWNIQKKLREIQSGLLQSDGKYWSFSKVVNMVLLGGLVGAESFGIHHWRYIISHIENGKNKHPDKIHTVYVNKIKDLKS